MAPVEAGVRGCQGACVSECVICVSASAIVWGWERAAGRGGGCGRCPRGRPRLGWGSCRRRRGRGGCQGGRAVAWVCGAAAGCRPRGQVLIRSVRAALVFSPPGRLRVCVCALRVIPGDAGVTVTPAQAAAPALPRAPHPGAGATREQRRGPRGGDQEGPAAATPSLPREGLPLAVPLFVVWGSAPPPLSLLAPGVSDWGWGRANDAPLPLPLETSGWGCGPSPPERDSENSGGAGGRLPGCI